MSELVQNLSTPPAPREAPVRAAPAAADASVRPDEAAAPASAEPAEPPPSEARRATIAVLNRPTRARLAYDQVASRTFVEVLDPRTGEVLFRFPPENMREHLTSLANSEPGGIINQVA